MQKIGKIMLILSMNSSFGYLMKKAVKFMETVSNA